jgi:glycosyltransferase involved in cell wall biosynthesis
VRLGVDATSVAPEGKGISRVQRRTVEALRRLGGHQLVVFARHPEEVPGATVRVSPPLTLWWEQVGLPRLARRYRLDGVLTWSERLPVAARRRYAVWLFEPPTHRIRMNRLSGAGAYQRASDAVTLGLWRGSLQRAAVVLTGSQATADAIPVAARPLYPGLDPEFTPGPGRTGRYVLHLASADPRDDHATALAAFARARAEGEGARLLVAGGLRGPGGAGVEYLGRVSDDELVALYRGAAAYLDTSLYEGFGFQVLEAMGCGAPVVATGVTSIPELVGDAALLCAAGDAAALGDALVRVLGDAALAGRLREAGLARAAGFTWDRTARELVAALEDAFA